MEISKEHRILVTGGTGVLGNYIIKELISKGYKQIDVFTRTGTKSNSDYADKDGVNFINGDVSALYPLKDCIDEADFVIHAAAIVSFDPQVFKKMHQVNVEGTANVMNLASNANVKKVIHVSSIAALGRGGQNGLISEKSDWVNSKYNSYYGITKYLAEREVWRSYFEGQDMAIVNPALILGDGAWDQSSLQIFKRAYDGIPFYPTGGTGIVDVKDVAKFIVSLMESSIKGERFVLSAENISYKDLFSKLANNMNKVPPKKPAKKWMLSLFWRFEKIKSLLTGMSPLVTRESVKSTAHQSKYDNSKSRSFNDFEYRSIGETIEEYSKAYLNNRSEKA